ncbi:MAG: heavy metal translocating P-type ATPase [bacterium]|nr:heavy metal translocating P-type ATPase [bacterium]
MASIEKLSLKIEGMHCASCVASIERGLSDLAGVDSSQVNLLMNSATVSFDPARLSETDIIRKIHELGFKASIATPDILTANADETRDARKQFLIALVISIPLMVFGMGPMLNGHQPIISMLWDGLIQAVTAGFILLYTGHSILFDAALQTRHLRANMNSLVGIGTVAAFGWSLWALYQTSVGLHEALYFDSAGMIIVLILLGRYLEARAKGRAGEAIQALLRLRPAKATGFINGIEIELEPDMIRPGMTLLVRPGERIAADGVVTDGAPIVDESMLTGESIPVEKKLSDTVIGGSLNGNSPFKMDVTRAGAESYLAMVIRMVSEAQSVKAPVQKLADTVAGVFVPIVLVLATLTLVGWLILAPEDSMAVKAFIAVLIISCPCALGLATPTAVLAGTGRAARAGILIRGGDILEQISRVNVMAFDKTGTLTEGRLQVVHLAGFGGLPNQHLLSLLGSLECHSEHPIGKAIHRYVKDQEYIPVKLEKIESRPGFGMTARHDEQLLAVGNLALMQESAVTLGLAGAAAEAEMALGRTVVYVALNGRAIGVISVADTVRADAAPVVTELKQSLEKVVMLSGDNAVTASAVAGKLGIEFVAEVRPEQKKGILDGYRRSGQIVAMVGDGINDAPALAAADVGIAVAGGTDIAIEAADVVLLRPDLHLLTRMLKLSRATLGVIKQNLFWAFFYNVIAIPVAAGLFYPLTGWTLSPMIAAGAMSFSSLFVVLNSLRLARIKL